MRVLSLTALLLLVACPKGSEAQAPDSSGDLPASYPCKTDAECTSPSCGPCESGAVLSPRSPSCVVNPCPNVPVICSPKKECVVK